MGYRSDIVAVFYTKPVGDVKKTEEDNEAWNKRNEAKLKLFVEENFPAEWKKPEWAENNEGLTMLENDTGVVFEFQISSVKWYESYPEVQKFNEFWDRFVALADAEVEDDEGSDPVFWACEFVRLGENDDDVETKSSDEAQFVLSVSRTIERNY